MNTYPKIVRVIKESDFISKGAYHCIGEITSGDNPLLLIIHPKGFPSNFMVIPSHLKVKAGAKVLFVHSSEILA